MLRRGSLPLPPLADKMINFLESDEAKEIGSAFGIQPKISELRNLLEKVEVKLSDFELAVKDSGDVYCREDDVWELWELKAATCEAEDLIDDLSRGLALSSSRSNNAGLDFFRRGPQAYASGADHRFKYIKESLVGFLKSPAVNRIYQRRNRVDVEDRTPRVERHRAGEEDADDGPPKEPFLGMATGSSEMVTVNSKGEEAILRDFPSNREAENLVGRTTDKEAILQVILGESVDSQCHVSVLPITGIAGVGKSRLAEAIFCNKKVVSHFKYRLWIRTLWVFDIPQIARAILRFATKMNSTGGCAEVDGELLLRHLQDELSGGRFLLVLDGFRTEGQDKWLSFKKLLNRIGGKGSWVVTTTRNTEMEGTGTVRPHYLQGLSEFDSFHLVKKSMGRGDSGELTVQHPEGELLHHCAGVPLYIKMVIRSLGYSSSDFRHDNIFLSESGDADDIFQGFKRNYEVLPLHLKHCLAYCSLFPKNCWIDRSSLIKLWMAQGLIRLVHGSSKNPEDLEDIGNDCLLELRRRGFISEVEEDEFGNIKFCKMQNLTYDFVEVVAGYEYYLAKLDRAKVLRRIVHASFDDSLVFREKLHLYMSRISGIRTFLLPNQSNIEDSLSEKIIEALMQKFLSLRALDLHEIGMKSVPSSLGNLMHLKYLDLSGNADIEMLPGCITSLYHLETLRLSRCEKLKELPEDISKLKNLRHLDIDGCIGLSYMPSGIGELSLLRTLSLFILDRKRGASSHKGGLRELQGLNFLSGGLEIRHLEMVRSSPSEALLAELEKKEHLETLKLVWEKQEEFGDYDMSESDQMILFRLRRNQNLKGLYIYGYSGLSIPGALPGFPEPLNLVKITISDCDFCQYLPSLHQYPKLKYLVLEKLMSLDYVCDNDRETTMFFPVLEQLCLRELRLLKRWFGTEETQLQPRSFPSLSTLTIDGCPMLTSIPSFPMVKSLTFNKISKEQFRSLLRLSSTSLLSSSPSRLNSLCISYVKDLVSLSELHLEDLSSLHHLEIRHCPSLLRLPSLSSVTSLTISACPRLASLSGWVDHLPALKKLKLKWCPHLDLSYSDSVGNQGLDLEWWPQFDFPSFQEGSIEEGFDLSSKDDGSRLWGELKNLISIEIVGIAKLVSLPEGLRRMNWLQEMEISACDGLTELPEWIDELQSLRRLSLSFCNNLKSLPRGLDNLKELHKLKILGCPLLAERYNKETGTYRQKISHIWDIKVE